MVLALLDAVAICSNPSDRPDLPVCPRSAGWMIGVIIGIHLVKHLGQLLAGTAGMGSGRRLCLIWLSRNVAPVYGDPA